MNLERHMYRKGTMALAVAAALGLPHAAKAQSQDELKALREQVRQLDKRVQDAEATAQQAAVQASSRPTGENALNPAVSLILNGIYSNLSQDPNTYKINGFVPTNGEVAPPPARPEPGRIGARDHGQHRPHVPRHRDLLHIARRRRSESRKRTYRLSRSPTASRSRQGGFSPPSGTRTRSTRTPGTSPTRRSR